MIDNEFFSIDSSLHSSSQFLTLASTPCQELMKLVGSLNMWELVVTSHAAFLVLFDFWCGMSFYFFCFLFFCLICSLSKLSGHHKKILRMTSTMSVVEEHTCPWWCCFVVNLSLSSMCIAFVCYSYGVTSSIWFSIQVQAFSAKFFLGCNWHELFVMDSVLQLWSWG